jgi:Protein of unknown function (DUF1236)
MKAKTTITLAAAALLAGVTAASAAEVASSHGGMAMNASDSLSLDTALQTTAWNDLSSQPTQNAPTNFDATAGAKVPSSLTIKTVPSYVARDVSQLRPYDFAKVQGKLLIVNPSDRTIAEVISG